MENESKIRIIPKRQGVFFYSKNENDMGVLEITEEQSNDLLSGNLMFNETLDGLVPYAETEERTAFLEKMGKGRERANKMFALKTQLALLDQKSQENADGYYTQPEWDKIRAVRIWLRERIKKLANESYASNIPQTLQTLSANAFVNDPPALLDMPAVAFDELVVDGNYTAGHVGLWNGVKYLCRQNVLLQAHQPPDMANGAMLAIWQPFQDKGKHPWLYGEYVERGFQRQDPLDNEWYVLNADNAGANIYPPSQVPAIWKKV